MANLRVELISAGVRSLLKSPEMKGICKDQASAIRARCGVGYETDEFQGKTRVNAMVYPVTRQANADNMRNNTILKAIK